MGIGLRGPIGGFRETYGVVTESGDDVAGAEVTLPNRNGRSATVCRGETGSSEDESSLEGGEANDGTVEFSRSGRAELFVPVTIVGLSAIDSTSLKSAPLKIIEGC